MSTDSQPLHEMNPTQRFSDRVADYVKFRPTYPTEAMAAVIDGLGAAASLVIADIGAGTGISTRVLARTGANTIGVEPNDEMRKAAASDAENAGLRIEWRSGTAEATGLAIGSVDVVACAQAFHWFRASDALTEFAKVLRPGGRVALIWNDRDASDALSAAYSRLIDEASQRHAAANDHTRPGALFESDLFRDARELTFKHVQQLDLPGLIGRATSASYIPKKGPRLDSLKQGLSEAFAQHERNGVVELRYVTRAFLAEKRSSVIIRPIGAC